LIEPAFIDSKDTNLCWETWRLMWD